jgi:hypothetical protein
MHARKSEKLFSILDGSPFFTELSVKDREKLIKELLEAYPQLIQNLNNDTEVGYEASWLTDQAF